jgi:hypothetical protein
VILRGLEPLRCHIDRYRPGPGGRADPLTVRP